MNPFSHFLPLLLPFFLSLGYKGIGPPSMKGKKVEIFWDKISLTVCKWSSLNAQSTDTPVSHPLLNESLFPFSAPASSSFPICSKNKLFIMGSWGKELTFFLLSQYLVVLLAVCLHSTLSLRPIRHPFRLPQPLVCLSQSR